MDLIDRYVYAVTRSLPQAQRKEVEKELRSDIQDMIEAEKGSEQKRIRTVLETLGRPETLALNYSGAKQYLIGPKWYGLYIETLKKIGYVAIPIIFLIVVLEQTFASDTAIIQRIIDVIVKTIGFAMQILLWTTAVFVFLEHSQSRTLKKDKEKILAWSVDQLPQLPPERHTKLSDTIANIVVYGVFIGLILLTKHTLGFDMSGTHVSFFDPELWAFWLWAIIATLVGLALKEVYTLKYGRESVGSIWAKVVLEAVLLATFAGLYLKDMLINDDFATKTNDAWVGGLSLEEVVGATLILWGIGFVWDTAKSFRQLKR